MALPELTNKITDLADPLLFLGVGRCTDEKYLVFGVYSLHERKITNENYL